MTAVLRANLRAEIVGGLGIRPQRISLRPATTDLLLPRQPEVLRNIVAATAERGLAAISDAVRAHGGGRSDYMSRVLASERRPGMGRNGHPQPS
jgi:hypothetical protein